MLKDKQKFQFQHKRDSSYVNWSWRNASCYRCYEALAQLLPSKQFFSGARIALLAADLILRHHGFRGSFNGVFVWRLTTSISDPQRLMKASGKADCELSLWFFVVSFWNIIQEQIGREAMLLASGFPGIDLALELLNPMKFRVRWLR